MAERLGDLVSERALETFVGREREMAALCGLLEEGPLVAYVHGIAGIGKSTLLDAFAAHAIRRGVPVVRIDCRTVEPTPRGYLAALATALDCRLRSLSEAAAALAGLGPRIVIALDTYENFRLLDTWVRQALVPALPTSARVLIAGRLPPSAAWHAAPGWHGLFRSLRLEPLATGESDCYLDRVRVPRAARPAINRLARGHPLALSMAASLAIADQDHGFEGRTAHAVIEHLARAFLDSVPDNASRTALEAASVVRCVTEPLLQALLPDTDAEPALAELADLPFAERSREGLFIHDAVRDAIAASLEARDPSARRRYRHAAWKFLEEESHRARASDLWRCTANLLFLLENPVLREAFFPSGPHPLVVEPATFADGAAVRRITARHDPAQHDVLDLWWRHQQDAFHVARDSEGAVAGFYVMVRCSELAPAVLAGDPVAAAICADLAGKDLSRSLVIRRWLDRNRGEAPSPTQAASWVDAKRTYLEMRGVLRWVYMALGAPRPYAEVATRLGFRPIPGATAQVGEETVYSFLVDMGPGSVDSWLASLVGDEVATDAPPPLDVFDPGARELVLPWGRVGLTPLEFGVMRELHDHPGKAVSRYELMEAVWNYANPTASNVVDVVVRSLRKKLGAEARLIETVRGTGYRYRRTGRV
jgi:hypothetical protein